MKAIVENVNNLLAELQINVSDYFTAVNKCDNDSVICALSPDYKYASDLDKVKVALEECFYLHFVCDLSFGKITESKLMLISK